MIIDSQDIYIKRSAFYCFQGFPQQNLNQEPILINKCLIDFIQSEHVKTVWKSVINLRRKIKVSLNLSLFWLVHTDHVTWTPSYYWFLSLASSWRPMRGNRGCHLLWTGTLNFRKQVRNFFSCGEAVLEVIMCVCLQVEINWCFLKVPEGSWRSLNLFESFLFLLSSSQELCSVCFN